jgi:hypothetical protein
MLLSEREVDSDFSLMEVDIREGSSSRDSRIQSESELTYHDFSLELYDPVIELRECRREVRRGKYSSLFYHQFERGRMIHREILIRIGFHETLS